LNEHQEQVVVVNWARENEYRFPALKWLHSSLNGIVIPASPKVKAKIINYMKAEGMKRGVPDLCLVAARKGFNGFYWETKLKNGEQRPDQKRFQEHCDAENYFYGLGAGAACIETLEWYLGKDHK